MPTVEELQQLEALIAGIAPISSVERGELIRAQDWNALAGAVVQLAQILLAREKDTTVPPHQHLQQVTIDWLDPQLSTLIQRGPLTDPISVSRFDRFDQRMIDFSARLETLNGGIQQVRDNVTRISTNDLKREFDVTAVRRNVENLSNSGQEVLALRQTLQSVQSDVQNALQVGANLTINGQPADLQALANRVTAVEGVTAGLKTVTGEPFTAAGLELRLTQLTNTLVTQDQLDSALKNHTFTIPDTQVTGIRDAVTAAVKTDVTTTLQQFQTDLRNETTQRLADVNNLVSKAVGDAQPGLKDSVLGTIRPEIATAVSQSATNIQNQFETRLSQTSDALTKSFSGQLAGVQAGIAPAVKAEIDKQVPLAIGAIKNDVNAIGTRLSTAEGRISDHETRLTTVGTRVEAVAQQDTSARSQMRQDLLSEMDKRDVQRGVDLNTRLAAEETTIFQKMDTRFSDAQTQLVQQVNKAASDAAAAEVKLAANQLRGEMRSVARDEAGAVQQQLPNLVNSQVQQAFTAVPGIVNREVLRQAGTHVLNPGGIVQP